ncbi:MAG: hypothetical protein ABFR36_01745 [Acidobacteriota bacterium]
MDKNGSKILFKLSGAVSGDIHGPCPSPEDISALIDGTIGKELKKELQNHISSCDICYETYKSTLELIKSSDKKSFRIFSPLSIAASIFFALAAFVIFYKVNVSVKDLDPVSPFSSSPVIVKEGKVEHKSDKRKVGIPVSRKLKKKSSKPPAPEKSMKVQKMEEVVREEEVPEVRDEPVTVPAALSVGEVKAGSDNLNRRSGRVSSVSYKSGKGLVDKFKEVEKGKKDKNTDMNCFTREGDEYIRRISFKTDIPLRDTFPDISKMVQPDNYKADDPVTGPVYIIVEVIANKIGDVIKVCVASGSAGNIKLVVEAVKKWKFKIPENSPSRFRLVLGISGSRIIEVLDKK